MNKIMKTTQETRLTALMSLHWQPDIRQESRRYRIQIVEVIFTGATPEAAVADSHPSVVVRHGRRVRADNSLGAQMGSGWFLDLHNVSREVLAQIVEPAREALRLEHGIVVTIKPGELASKFTPSEVEDLIIAAAEAGYEGHTREWSREQSILARRAWRLGQQEDLAPAACFCAEGVDGQQGGVEHYHDGGVR